MIYTICDFFNTLSIFEQLHFFVSKRSFLDAPTFLFYNKL